MALATWYGALYCMQAKMTCSSMIPRLIPDKDMIIRCLVPCPCQAVSSFEKLKKIHYGAAEWTSTLMTIFKKKKKRERQIEKERIIPLHHVKNKWTGHQSFFLKPRRHVQ